MLAAFLLVIGLITLLTGGDALVRGAVSVAERFHVPHVIIGLTIVAIGTSAPEMFVSVNAALNNAGGLAIGNVVGSNIANVLLVLGLPSLIAATNCREEGIGRNLVVMAGFTVVFMGMISTGRLERYDGAILLVLCGLFLFDQFNHASEHRRRLRADGVSHRGVPRRTGLAIALLLFGFIALPLGASMTVAGASAIARGFGISQEVIGLTVIAIGTSLPELATSLFAVWRGKGSVAIGNVVGSNIFNIAAIMGVTAVIVPIPIRDRVIRVDMWVMLACALLLVVLAHHNVSIGRRLGLAMTGAYIIYITATFWLN